MKKILFIVFLFLSKLSFSQYIDTVINAGIYTSYFSYTLHQPLYVSYKLYKGGGNCSRKNVIFKTGDLPNSASQKDYTSSGYDKGHLANSKDFAYDCQYQEKTFRFYNCVPQTPRLNRGVWKHYESALRDISQYDSILVICGSIFGNKTIGPNKISIPSYCWKIAYSLSTKKLIMCKIFPNDNSNTVEDITIDKLKAKLLYKTIF